MHKCVCGRSYNHSSNLYRHQNGNKKEHIQPCLHWVSTKLERLKQQSEAKADELVSRLEEHGKRLVETTKPSTLVIEDHDPRAIPDFVDTREIFVRVIPDSNLPFQKRLEIVEDAQILGKRYVPTELRKMILKVFTTVHMNEDHPEYWNVVLLNKSTMDLWVREKGKWVDKSFKEWATEYAYTIMSKYMSVMDELYPPCCQYYLELLEGDMKKDVVDGLKSILRSPHMRKLIKKRYDLR